MRLPGWPVAQGGRYGPGGAVVGVPSGGGEIGERALQRPAHVFRLPLLRPVEAPACGDQLPQSLAALDVLLDTPARARLGSSEYAQHGGGHRLDPT